MIPPAVASRFTEKERMGVGRGSRERITSETHSASTRAVSSAASRERNLVS